MPTPHVACECVRQPPIVVIVVVRGKVVGSGRVVVRHIIIIIIIITTFARTLDAGNALFGRFGLRFADAKRQRGELTPDAYRAILVGLLEASVLRGGTG